MATVTIKSVKRQNILSDEEYEYIKANLNKPLQLLDLSWYKSGEVCAIAIYCDDDACITLFVDSNGLEYEVNIDAGHR
jgi:hypothetical protein